MEGNTTKNGPSDAVIRFNCSFCGQHIRVPKTVAGKKGRCPKCKRVVIVPQLLTASEPVTAKSDTAKADDPLSFSDLLLQQPTQHKSDTAPPPDMQKDEQYEMLRQSAGLSSLQESPPPKRENPWFVDIFLYPANTYGMIFLGIAALLPLILQLLIILLVLLVGIFAVFFIILNIIIDVVLAMFVFWFLAECIRDSASGNLRVPDTIAETPGLAEMGLRILRLTACFALCAVPAFYYHRHTQRTDLPFWLLLGTGIFLYPMALLAVVMFDSIGGLNPIIIVPSIFSTFFQYCGLVIFAGLIVFLFLLTRKIFLSSPLLFLCARIPQVYLTMVAAHLLGRFYFKYQEKLNWDV